MEQELKLYSELEATALLRAIFSILQMPRNADTANNSDRVTIAAWSVWIAASQTLATLTNLQQLNGVQAHQMSVASEITAWYSACRTTIQ